MSIPVISSRRSRTPGQVELHISPKSPMPELPYELHEHVTAETWAARIPQLIRLCNRYSRPVLEVVWFTVMVIFSIGIPLMLHDPIFHWFEQKLNLTDAISETRFISFVIAIVVLMLFFGPHIAWKFMGQKRVTELVKRWKSEDARLHAPGSFVPVWSVKLAGCVSYDSHLTITTPYAPPPSYYHPVAYQPAWINARADSSFRNDVPATYQGFQQQKAMHDVVPLYGNGLGLSPPPYARDGRAYSDGNLG